MFFNIEFRNASNSVSLYIISTKAIILHNIMLLSIQINNKLIRNWISTLTIIVIWWYSGQIFTFYCIIIIFHPILCTSMHFYHTSQDSTFIILNIFWFCYCFSKMLLNLYVMNCVVHTCYLNKYAVV